MYSRNPVIISGILSDSSGMPCSIPSAIYVSNCSPASTRDGANSSSDAPISWTIWTMPSSNIGRLSIMPWRIAWRTSTPKDKNSGSFSTSAVTILPIALERASSAPSTPFTRSLKAVTTLAMEGRNSANRLFFTLDTVSPSWASVSSSRIWFSRAWISASLFR